MFNPLDLFSSVKGFLIAGAVVAALSVIGVLWFEKNSAEREVLTLTQEKAKLENLVLAREIEVGGLKIAMEALEKTTQTISDNQKIEAENQNEIDNATPDQDGPVAPVLRNALDGVGRMYHNAHP